MMQSESGWLQTDAISTVWIKHEWLGEFLPPYKDLKFSDSGSVSKDMKRDVITLCKHTKDKVYDRRKEECKNNVGTAIGRSQPETCLDIRKKDHKLQGKKWPWGRYCINITREEILSSFLRWLMLNIIQCSYLLQEGRGLGRSLYSYQNLYT